MMDLVQPGDVVFHLAALIGIPYSYAAPRSYVETNINGTMNLLEAARRREAARLLVVSTSEVYGTAQFVPITEEHPLQGQSPYSASKIGAEKLAESYAKSFELPVTVVRPFNTFGPRQSPRAVIATILMQLMHGVKELMLGDPSTTRDFNYVADTAEGMIRLAACPDACGRAVNIGTGTEVSIQQVVEQAQAVTGCSVAIRQDPARIRPVASEVRRLCADNQLLKELTGWTPPSRLEEGLRYTAEWMKEQAGRYDPQRYYI
jgi:nucleoside-diphosphate-sugar epimerase